MNPNTDLLSIQKSINDVIAHIDSLSTLLKTNNVANNSFNENMINLQAASDIVGELDIIRKSNVTLSKPIKYDEELIPWHEQFPKAMPQLAGDIIPGGYIIDLDSLLRVLYQKTDITSEKSAVPVDGIKLYFTIESLTAPQLSFGIVGFKGDFRSRNNDLKTFAENQFEPCKPC
jgi:hypothetical protein